MRKNATRGIVFLMFFDVYACWPCRKKGIEGQGLSRANLRAKSANVQRTFVISKRYSYNIHGKEQQWRRIMAAWVCQVKKCTTIYSIFVMTFSSWSSWVLQRKALLPEKKQQEDGGWSFCQSEISSRRSVSVSAYHDPSRFNQPLIFIAHSIWKYKLIQLTCNLKKLKLVENSIYFYLNLRLFG